MSFDKGGKSDSDEAQKLFVIRLTAPGDPKHVIGYAMAEQIDFVPKREGLLGATKEALEAAEQAFKQAKTIHDAVALAPHKPTGVKMFALIGSGENSA
ncbi:MAG: hypothetical protein ABW173_03470 [Sphingomonas sp.]